MTGLPTGWTEVTLGEVVQLQDGPFGSNLKSEHYVPDGIRVIRLQNIGVGRFVDRDQAFISPEHFESLRKHECQPGDVLIATLGDPIVRACEQPAGVGPALNKADCVRARADRSQVAPRFLVHLVNSPIFQARAAGGVHGQTRQRVNLGQLRSLPIPLPPVEEQRRIAAILDKADGLRAKRRAALAQLDTLTQAIFLDMFGDESSSPGAWPVAPLAQVVDPSTIVTYGIVQAGDEYAGGVPYIRTGDIVDGAISTDGLRRTDPAIAAKFARSAVRAGDIVMSIRATVGTTAMVPEELAGANLTQGTARICPGPAVVGTYLLGALRSPSVQRWIARQVKGATFREITLARLRELPVRLPPVEFQATFAQRCAAAAASSAASSTSGIELDQLFASLKSRAFQGGL